MNSYDIGDLVELHLLVTGSEGTPVTPATVELIVRDPTGEVTTYDYALGTVVRSDVGSYLVQLTPRKAGIWVYRWVTTGVGQGAEERRFYVRAPSAVEEVV